jgi:hypothetical protein
MTPPIQRPPTMPQMPVPIPQQTAPPSSTGAVVAEGWPLLRWLANYGLSLSAADVAVPGPEDRDRVCPFAQFFSGVRGKSV